MEVNIGRARSEVVGGQPQYAHILADAMSQWRGNTPKIGGGDFRHSKNDATFVENRVMAVEMVCGPIDCVRLYHTNNLVNGGANYMITVLKLAIEDLSSMLQAEGFALPPHLIINFDNCGENKNQFMFAYTSLLVELCLFDTIEINFLMVGHTHCSVDRMFGTFSEAINSSYFIASPQALRQLLINCTPHRKVFNKEIMSVFDWKKLLQPYINKAIKYYGIPHNFKIQRYYDRAIFQYRLFCTYNWQPILPFHQARTNEDFENLQVTQVQMSPLFVVGGEDELLRNVGGDSKGTKSLLADKDRLEVVNCYSESKQILLNLEANAVHQQIRRLTEEAEGHIDLEGQSRYKTKPSEEREMLNTISQPNNNKQQGYMYWLVDGPSNLPPLRDSKPDLIYTKEMIENILQSLRTSNRASHQLENYELPPIEVSLQNNHVDINAKIMKERLLNLRNKALIITAAAKFFKNNLAPVHLGGTGRFTLNNEVGKNNSLLHIIDVH